MSESEQSDRIPRTEAGRSLIEGMRRGRAVGTLARLVVDEDWVAVVLAIEDEAAALVNPRLVPMLDRAAAPPEPPLDVERLRIAYEAGRAAGDFEATLARINATMGAAPERLPSVEQVAALRVRLSSPEVTER